MNDHPVRLGSMLFTLVDPHEGHEVAYNRWYERDHFYAGCLIGPWLFAGRRWVATKPLKDLRYPEDSPVAIPTEAGSYLAVYWVHADHHDEHFAWAGRQVHQLYSDGRGFPERSHVHTVLFDQPRAIYRDGDPVPVELALDHAYSGLVVTAFDRADDVPESTLEQTLDDAAQSHLLGDSSAVATVSSWKPIERDDITANAPMDLGSPTGTERRTLQLIFCDSEPTSVWEQVHAYTETVAATEAASVAFAGAFIPTNVGTDDYTDQLW